MKVNVSYLLSSLRLEFNLQDVSVLQLLAAQVELRGGRDLARYKRDVLVAGQRLDIFSNPFPNAAS